MTITADKVNAEHNINIVGLQTTDVDGNAPKSRIKDMVAARSVIDKMREMDDVRAKKRAMVQGLIDGNPPYDPDELKRLGQGHRSNVNFRDAEGHIDARKTSYYTLLTNVPCLAEVASEVTDPQNTNMDYGRLFSTRLDEMLRGWNGFMFNMQLHQSEMVKFGVGPVYFPDEITWKFRGLKHGSILVPNDADASIDTLEMVCIKHKYRAHELYARIATPEKEAASKKDGWDTDLIKLSLLRANRTIQPKDGQYSTSQYEEVQQMIKNNDYYYSYGVCDPIYVHHLMVKEYDGKISHYIATSEEADNEFLYKKLNRYQNMQRFINFFMSDVGDGEFHSVKGLGQKIYASGVVTNRMKNSAVDGAMLGASMVFQGDSDSSSINKMKMMRVGAFTVIEKGFTAVPNGMSPNVKPLIEVAQIIDGGMSHNVGTDRPEVIDAPGAKESQTLGESKMKFMREYRLEHSEIDLYYIHLDQLYKEIVRRILSPNWTTVSDGYEEREKFISRCKEDGIPMELLRNVDNWNVTATRAIGYGSPAYAHMVTNETLSLAPYMDEKGKKAAMFDWLMVRVGVKKAEEYLSFTNRNMIPTNEHVIATMENNFFKMGVDSIVGVDQMHVIHCLTHSELIKPMIEAYMQGQGEPVEKIFPVLQVAMPHFSQHIDAMKEDPARANEYKEYIKELHQFAKVYMRIARDFQQIQQQRQKDQQDQQQAIQQAQQGTEDPDLKVKLAKIDSDMKVSIMKEQNQQQIREAKTQHMMGLKDAITSQKLRDMQSKNRKQ